MLQIIIIILSCRKNAKQISRLPLAVESNQINLLPDFFIKHLFKLDSNYLNLLRLPQTANLHSNGPKNITYQCTTCNKDVCT